KSEWGEYSGRLKTVSLYAYDPSTKAMVEKAVAEYAYDGQGRLRAVWDPRISPALKTAYGYDEEGHVTAITPPGQESWAFTYGMIAGDTTGGRVLKVAQAPASSAVWGGELVKNVEAPKITGSAVLGTRLAVSDGKWSGNPAAYGYQWEDCNAEGKECTPIVGALNSNYTPVSSDVGHTLVALVTATNGDGSVLTASAASGSVVTAEITDYAAAKVAKQLVIGPDGNLWYTAGNNKVGKITTSGTATEYTLPLLSSPSGITVGSDSNLWFTDSESSKIGKVTTTGTITEYSLPASSRPLGIASGSDKNLWFSEYLKNKIGKITTAGVITEYSVPEKSSPYGMAAGSDNNLWFADYGTNKIGKITTAGVITEYPLAAHRAKSALGRKATSGLQTSARKRSARSRPQVRSPNMRCLRASLLESPWGMKAMRGSARSASTSSTQARRKARAGRRIPGSPSSTEWPCPVRAHRMRWASRKSKNGTRTTYRRKLLRSSRPTSPRVGPRRTTGERPFPISTAMAAWSTSRRPEARSRRPSTAPPTTPNRLFLRPIAKRPSKKGRNPP